MNNYNYYFCYYFSDLFLCIVGLYSDAMKGAIFVSSNLSSGVTQMIFSPCGNYLYSGERKVIMQHTYVQVMKLYMLVWPTEIRTKDYTVGF